MVVVNICMRCFNSSNAALKNDRVHPRWRWLQKHPRAYAFTQRMEQGRCSKMEAPANKQHTAPRVYPNTLNLQQRVVPRYKQQDAPCTKCQAVLHAADAHNGRRRDKR